jgi:hypothetical protein
MGICEKFKKIIESIEANWIYSLTLFIAFLSIIAGFFFDNYAYQVIGGLFFIIAVQNFYTHVKGIKDIKERLDTLNNPTKNHVVLKKRSCIKRMDEIILQAKEELFISGATLHVWYPHAELIRSKTNLKIKMLIYYSFGMFSLRN